MLARRFTIVCLLAALFGMFFSSLVAQTGRLPRAQALTASCQAVAGLGCSHPFRRF